MFEIIGFDLDNTLYKSTPEMQVRIRGKIYEKISELFKVPVEKARDLFETRYALLGSGGKTLKSIAQDYGTDLGSRDVIQESLEEADVLDFIQPNPELIIMLKRVLKDYALDLLTGSAKNLALRKLERIGIPSVFFGNILADEDGSKSTGDLYKMWVSLRNAHPAQFLYVGDNKKVDVEAPKSLGIKTCLLGKDSGADFHISHILELESLLEKHTA